MNLSKDSATEFMDFDYFYKGLDNFDSEGALVFSKITDCLKKDVVKLKELVSFIQTKRQIPEQARGVVWRVLLNYLPENRKYWLQIISNNSKHYEQLVNEFITSRNKKTNETKPDRNIKEDSVINESQKIPIKSNSTNTESQASSGSRGSTDLLANAPTITLNIKNRLLLPKKEGNVEDHFTCDHPLNKKQNSFWNSHFKDLEIWEMIEKDTRRTRAEFYLQKQENPKVYNGQIAKLIRKQQSESQANYSLINSQVEMRYDALTRILFLYYKITGEEQSVRYVQGMNEIVGLIYQCFYQDNSSYLKENAESDAFYCFCIVMTKVKNMFNFSKIQGSPLESHKVYVDAFLELFKKADLQLFNYLISVNVDPKLCCLNWMIGFFCQNFEAPKAMIVWDSLFISSDIIEFLPYLCVSILYISRDDLMAKQPSEILIKLQNISDLNIDKLIKMAFNLYNEFSQKINKS